MGRSDTDELVDEIEQIRLRLADTVDALADRTNPKRVAGRGLANVKSQFVDDQGSLRLETIVPVVAGAAAVVVAIVFLRRLTR